MHTPVAFLIFNRPDTTSRVFAEIARARPPKLLVIADGPRAEVAGEAEKCRATRAIIERVDWECEVLKNYSDVNLGCGRRPATGLSWVFDQVNEAIVLEDDCVPHPTFFRFCEELLEKYRDDERVMHISGDNFLSQKRSPFSYSFSRYSLSWGWATWRRAFRYFDFEIKCWPTLRETSWLMDILQHPRAVEHWKKVFEKTYNEKDNANIWDFQWLFTVWERRGLAILPDVNLVANIGFREDATHTKDEKQRLANLPTAEMKFPLVCPPRVICDNAADRAVFDEVLQPLRPTLYHGLRQKCAAALPASLRKWLSLLFLLGSKGGRLGAVLLVCSHL
jgi:hypothetical protein